MRTQIGFCVSALVLAAVGAVLFVTASRPGDAEPSVNRSEKETGLAEATSASIKLRLGEIGAPESIREDKLIRSTQEPFPVAPKVAAACASPFSQSLPDPHEGKSIHVFVTSNGCDTMKSGRGVYPRGTVILKEKFADSAGKTPVLFTGMLKREKGFDKKSGDWQFFALNSDATRVTTDKTGSCIDCHAPYRATDFVSRSYLVEKIAANRPGP